MGLLSRARVVAKTGSISSRTTNKTTMGGRSCLQQVDKYLRVFGKGVNIRVVIGIRINLWEESEKIAEA